ncbi:MAG: PadR family transcriptional regulator [Telluria sp.]
MEVDKYLPLSEASYYVLLALHRPLHGYGVMQEVEALSQGTVTLGPGTLYGAFGTLEKQALIEKAGEEERRKLYRLTTLGRAVVREQVRRLELMVRNARAIFPHISKEGVAA